MYIMKKEPHISFNRVERTGLQRGDRVETTVLSFETRQHGLLQVGYNDNIVEFRDEPNLNVFTKRDREYIESVLLIVSEMIHNTSSHKERFR